MFTLYQHPSRDVGSRVTVSIDYQKKLVKREFLSNASLVNGDSIYVEEEEQEELFNNELFWLTFLSTKIPTPPVVDIDFKKRTFIQQYFGPDLLTIYMQKNLEWNESHSAQLIQAYRAMYQCGVAKRNGSLSNMTFDSKGDLVFFDFKWAFDLSNPPPSRNCKSEGESAIYDEFYSISTYLKKIDPSAASEIELKLTAKLKDIG